MKVLTYEDYLIESEIGDLPTTIEELFKHIDIDLSEDLYESDEFTSEDLEILEEGSFYGLDSIYEKLMTSEEVLSESYNVILEKVGENIKRKFMRVKTKKVIHKLRMAYKEKVDALKKAFKKLMSKEKNPAKKESLSKKLAKKLNDLKKWLESMLAKIMKKSKSRSQLAIA